MKIYRQGHDSLRESVGEGYHNKFNPKDEKAIKIVRTIIILSFGSAMFAVGWYVGLQKIL